MLAAGSLLGFDCGNRGHVENAAGSHRWREDMRRPRRADQDRPDWQRIRKHLVGTGPRDAGDRGRLPDHELGLVVQAGIAAFMATVKK